MDLIIIEKETKKRIKLFSNPSESVLDSITTKYDSAEEFLESLNLDSKNFSVVKSYSDKNGNIDFAFLPRKYDGITDVMSSKENQEEFIDTIFNADYETVHLYVTNEFCTRANYNSNKYLKEAKATFVPLFHELDCLIEFSSRKNVSESIMESERKVYKDLLNQCLYMYGKPVYTNFLGFYKHLCNENVIENNMNPEDPDLKEKISSIFRDSLKKRIENGSVKSVPRDSLIKLDLLKSKLEETKQQMFNDEPFHSAITESYDDIDDFETNLDILMDEQGLDDEEKITARNEMRKKFEKKNKIL